MQCKSTKVRKYIQDRHTSSECTDWGVAYAARQSAHFYDLTLGEHMAEPQPYWCPVNGVHPTLFFFLSLPKFACVIREKRINGWVLYGVVTSCGLGQLWFLFEKEPYTIGLVSKNKNLMIFRKRPDNLSSIKIVAAL